MVLCVEIVNQKTYPAGDKHKHAADDLSNKGDGLLEDVKNRKDGQYQTGDVKDCSKHNY